MVSFIKKYKSLAAFGGIYAVVLYSLMMTQQLTNTYDGLWHQNYRQPNSHELSLGRWCLLFLDKMCMGLHADPVISLAALALFAFGFILVIDLFDIHNKLAQAEENFEKAHKEFTAAHPEGYHLTLKDGDFETTLSGTRTVDDKFTSKAANDVMEIFNMIFGM